MDNRLKISAGQIFWLTGTLEIGMTLLLSLTSALQEAQQDAWISTLLATVFAMSVAFVSGQIQKLFPGQTLVEVCISMFGKWFGRAILLPYFVMWFSVIGIILRQSTAFLHIALFQRTPLWALMAVMSLLILYLTYTGGIEGVGRVSELVGPIILFMVISVLLLNIGNLDLKQVLPVYVDSGWFKIVKGGISPAAFLGESIILTMTLAFVDQPQKAVRNALWSIGLAGFFITLSTLSIVMTFSTMAAKMAYPYFEMTRFISVLEFIQNVDVLVVIVWILSVFVKLSWYLFITSYAVAQWLNLKNWRNPMWVIVPVAFTFGIWFRSAVTASVDYPKRFWIPYILPINIIAIPLLLWIVGLVQKHWKKTQLSKGTNPKNR